MPERKLSSEPLFAFSCCCFVKFLSLVFFFSGRTAKGYISYIATPAYVQHVSSLCFMIIDGTNLNHIAALQIVTMQLPPWRESKCFIILLVMSF